MMRRFVRVAAFAALAVLPLAACEDGPGLGSEQSELEIWLTDAPGDFEEAVVTISEIYLQGDEESDDESGRVYLREEPFTTDLLTLANDVATLVEGATVPEGTYGQLRFVISGGYIVVEQEDGTNKVYATQDYAEVPDSLDATGTLKCPSCEQTGIKVILPGGGLEVTGEQKVLLVDFDVSQTFGHQAGASGMWVMRPTLKATDISLSGSVAVAVEVADSVTWPVVNGDTLGIEDVVATLKAAEDTTDGPGERVALDSAGVAEFTYVVPGDYEISLAAGDSVTLATDPAMPQTITVDSGEEEAVTYEITAATKP